MDPRKFSVIVLSVKRPFSYPPLSGRKAIDCMKTLTKRGHSVIARTSAHGITEDLTLSRNDRGHYLGAFIRSNIRLAHSASTSWVMASITACQQRLRRACWMSGLSVCLYMPEPYSL